MAVDHNFQSSKYSTVAARLRTQECVSFNTVLVWHGMVESCRCSVGSWTVHQMQSGENGPKHIRLETGAEASW